MANDKACSGFGEPSSGAVGERCTSLAMVFPASVEVSWRIAAYSMFFSRMFTIPGPLMRPTEIIIYAKNVKRWSLNGGHRMPCPVMKLKETGGCQALEVCMQRGLVGQVERFKLCQKARHQPPAVRSLCKRAWHCGNMKKANVMANNNNNMNMVKQLTYPLKILSLAALALRVLSLR